MSKNGGKSLEERKPPRKSKKSSRPPWAIPDPIEPPATKEETEEQKVTEPQHQSKDQVAANSHRRHGRQNSETCTMNSLPPPPVEDSRQFSVIEHLDLVTDTSSEDMDLNSDHERLSPDSVHFSIPPTAETMTPKSSTPVSGVTMGQGGPGTQLHWELTEYDRMSRLTPQQSKRRAEIISIVADAAKRVCPGCLVMPFGGYANGLCTPDSDIDLVIVGVAVPNADHGGYKDPEKTTVGHLLSSVLDELTRGLLNIRKHLVIKKARIPIIKLTTADYIDVDISICDDHGPRAADFMRVQGERFPELRPIVLAIKGLVKAKHLNEVVTGGIGTYALSNMVLAHLMINKQKHEPVEDLGCLLVSFFELFGKKFDYINEAVSIRSGGVCKKSDIIRKGIVVARNYEINYSRRSEGGDPPWERLLVEDYFTGRDVSSGTFRIGEIQRLFGAIFRRLSGQYLIPPLPPDSPYLSTLSTLFPVVGSFKNGDEKNEEFMSKPEKLPKRRRFSEVKASEANTREARFTMGSASAPRKSSVGPGGKYSHYSEHDVHDFDRADFFNGVKRILHRDR